MTGKQSSENDFSMLQKRTKREGMPILGTEDRNNSASDGLIWEAPIVVRSRPIIIGAVPIDSISSPWRAGSRPSTRKALKFSAG